MSKLNFEYLNKDNKNLFNVTLEKESLVQSKVISLENLIKILQTLNNTVDKTDTGYLPKNLLRSVSSPSSNKALYHFPYLITSPKLDINSFNHKTYKLFNKPYFQLSFHDTYVCFNNYKILNIILYLNYNKHNTGYKVMHLNTAESLFNSTLLNDNAKAFPPIFPNHFETSICWGGTGFGSTLMQYFNNNDLDKLQEIPFVYFNSTFNTDLRNRNTNTDSLVSAIRSNQDLILEHISSVTGEDPSTYRECFSFGNFDLLAQFALLKPMLENETLYNNLCRSLSQSVSFKSLME